MLTEDETEAVLLGLRYVDQRGDDVLTKAAANAHAKILAVLPQEGQIAATLPMAIPGPKASGFPDNKVPLNCQTTSGIDPLATRRIDPLCCS
jgi:hypothetical protein